VYANCIPLQSCGNVAAMFISRIQVEEGFLDGLDLTFADGLRSTNVIASLNDAQMAFSSARVEQE
jgi:hypothetical protein